MNSYHRVVSSIILYERVFDNYGNATTLTYHKSHTMLDSTAFDMVRTKQQNTCSPHQPTTIKYYLTSQFLIVQSLSSNAKISLKKVKIILHFDGTNQHFKTQMNKQHLTLFNRKVYWVVNHKSSLRKSSVVNYNYSINSFSFLDPDDTNDKNIIFQSVVTSIISFGLSPQKFRPGEFYSLVMNYKDAGHWPHFQSS